MLSLVVIYIFIQLIISYISVVKIDVPVEDLCRVSGEVAAALMSIYQSPNYTYTSGNVHMFRVDAEKILHGKLTVLDRVSGVRIVAEKERYRDGSPIKGDLIEAVEKVLKRRSTIGLAINSEKVLSHLRNIEGSSLEQVFKLHQVYMRDGKYYLVLNI